MITADGLLLSISFSNSYINRIQSVIKPSNYDICSSRSLDFCRSSSSFFTLPFSNLKFSILYLANHCFFLFFVNVLLFNWSSCLMFHSVASITSPSSIIFHSLIVVIRVKQSATFSGSSFFSLLNLLKFRYASINENSTLKLFNIFLFTSIPRWHFLLYLIFDSVMFWKN